MSSGNQDKIVNFQRNVLIARAKVDNKNLNGTGTVSDRIRSKKSPCESVDVVTNKNVTGKIRSKKKSEDIISNVKGSMITDNDPSMPISKEVSRENNLPSKTSSTKKETNSSNDDCSGKSFRQTEKISPTSRAPDQKKRKRSNVLAHSEYHGSVRSNENSEVLLDTNLVANVPQQYKSEKPPLLDFPKVSPSSSSEMSLVIPNQPTDYNQELQELAKQLSSEPQTYTLSPIQSKMSYGQSRYSRPQQVQDNHSYNHHDISSFGDVELSYQFFNQNNAHALPELMSHNYPPGLGPPGLGPPELGPPGLGPPGLRPPGLGPPGLGPPVFETPQLGSIGLRPTHVKTSVLPSFNSHIQNREGSIDTQVDVCSDKSAVSNVLKYSNLELITPAYEPKFFNDETCNTKSLPISDSKNNRYSFIGKHPSLTRKSGDRDKLHNEVRAPHTDCDGEVRAILMGGNQNKPKGPPYSVLPVYKSGQPYRTASAALSNRGEVRLQKYPTPAKFDNDPKSTIPCFSQLKSSSEHQVPSRGCRGRGKPRSSRNVEDTNQTPPGPSSNNRVQDSHWSPGSGVLSDSGATSPAGRAGRHSSPLNRAGRYSSPSNRGRYTGKPRSSNSSPITREVKISKALSGICRHKHGSETLMMLEGGYFSVEEILNTSRFKQLSVTRAEVVDIVKSNDKQRFSLKELEGNLLICANQGHSFEVQGLELERIESGEGYTGIVHGTYDAAWESIRRQGLSKMNRTHIHFAVGLPSNRQVISGMRGDCQVAVYIDMSAAIKDGLEFYKSKNNVILCSGNEDGLLPTKYFTSVVRIKGQRQLLHETRPVGFNPEQSASCHGNTPGTDHSEADRSNNWRKAA